MCSDSLRFTLKENSALFVGVHQIVRRSRATNDVSSTYIALDLCFVKRQEYPAGMQELLDSGTGTFGSAAYRMDGKSTSKLHLTSSVCA